MGLVNALATLSNIEPNMISMISNIILFVLIGIVLIGGIVGLIRGVWSSTFRLLFVGVLVILAYALSGVIGNAVADMDIGKYFNGQVIFVNDIEVQITSIKETLIRCLGAFGTSQGGSLEKTLANPDTLALVTELALMIVRFITFIVLAVIIIIFGNLLATILYHLLFKHLINKKLRNKVKLRAVGFLTGALKTALVLSMLVVPFSSVINSLSKAFNKNDEQLQELDNETYNQLMSWINAYDDSLLAKVLFNWTKDGDGNTLDMKLMNIVTSTKDSTMNFCDELSSVAGLAVTLFGSDAVSFESTGVVINMPIIMSGEIVSVLVSQMTSSSLIMQALPIAVDFALSMDGVENYVTTNQINLEEVDWEKDLNALNDFYQDLYAANVINSDVVQNPNLLVSRIFDVNDEGVHTTVKNSLKKLDNIELINQLFPSLIWTMANQKNEAGEYVYPFSDFLPLEVEAYQNIRWGNEFSILYDSVYRINDVVDNAIVEYVQNPASTPEDENKTKHNLIKYLENSEDETETVTDERLTDLLNKILNKAPEIGEIIVGERDANGNIINVDTNGITNAGQDNCLFDSELLEKSLDKILSSTIDLIASSMKDIEISTDQTKQEIDKLETRLSFKKEFGAMFDIISEVVKDEKLKTMFDGGEIVIDEEMCEALKKPAAKIDESCIISSLMPEILRATFTKEEAKLKEFNLELDSINYNVSSFSNELINLLDTVPALFTIADTFGKDVSNGEKISSIDSQDLEDLLTFMYKSDILNHKWSDKRQNFYKIMDKLFTMMGYEGNITEGLENLTWVGENSEISYLGDFFDSFKAGGLSDLLSSEENVDYLNPDVINPDSVADLFGCIENSHLLKKGVGPILDTSLKDMLNTFDNVVSFQNIHNWREEGENFAVVLNSLQELNMSGTSLESIDFLNSDAVDENGELLTKNLAHALEKSQLFSSKTAFGDFLLDKLKAVEALDMSDVMSSEANKTYVKSEEIFANISTLSEDNDVGSGTWNDEVDIMFDFIKALQAIGREFDATRVGQYGNAGLDAVIDSPQTYRDVFVADGTAEKYGIANFRGINSSEAFRMPVVNAIYEAATNIRITSMADLDVQGYINIGSLVAMDDVSARNQEVDTICDLMISVDKLRNLANFNDIKNSDEHLLELENAMTSLHNSRIFNTLNETKDMTVFENFITTSLKVSGISEDAIVGRIGSNTLKNNSIANVVKGITNNHCNTSQEDEWIKVYNDKNEVVSEGEIKRVINVIHEISTIDIANIGSKADWAEGEAEILLSSLNSSKLLYRCVPYYINEFVKNTNVSSLSGTFYLDAAKTDYTYDAAAQDFVAYDAEEVTNLAVIIENFGTLNDLAGDSYNLQTLKTKIPQLEKVLISLSESRTFHREGAANGRENTVFIQVINEMFEKSHLSEAIYYATLFNYNGLSAQESAEAKIHAFDAEEKLGKQSWSTEIQKITGIFDVISNDGANQDSTDVSSINVSDMTPDNIERTFYTINASELCYDAVPKYVKETFTRIDIVRFSGGFEDYLMEAYCTDSTTYRDIYESDEIKNLGDFLRGISTTEGYINFGGAFSISKMIDSTNSEGENISLTCMVRFLTNSKVFNNCRGLVLYNAIDSVGFAANIRDDYKTEKTTVFSNILDKIEEIGEAQIVREGTCLDTITASLETVISDSGSGSNTLESIDSTAIKAIFENCYKDGKALISCEIVSGFLSNAINDSSYLDDDYTSETANASWFDSWYKDGINDFQYPKFNDVESSSIAAMIDIVKSIKNFTITGTTPSFNRDDIDSLKASLGQINDNSVIARDLFEKGMYAPLMNNTNGIFHLVKTGEVLFFGSNQTNREKFNAGYTLLETNADAYPSAPSTFDFAEAKTGICEMFDAIAAQCGL